jgi:hypothetical protein
MGPVARHRLSPAIVVGVLALVAGLAGTTLAADPAANTGALSKKKVKKIAKKQATRQINKLAPGLSVAHADTADTASSADTASTADTANRFGGMTARRIDQFTLVNGGTRTLGTFGPFRLTATCTINLANTDVAEINITTNQNNSAFVGEAIDSDFDVGDTVPYVEASITPTGTPLIQEDSGAAIAPGGTEILGHQLFAGVNILNQPGRCRFGGVLFVR